MSEFAILLGLNVAFCVGLFLYSRRRIRKELGEDALLERLRREIGAMVADLNGATDRDITLVEERSAALRELLASVDRKIALLGKEIAKRDAEREVFDKLSRARRLSVDAAPRSPFSTAPRQDRDSDSETRNPPETAATAREGRPRMPDADERPPDQAPAGLAAEELPFRAANAPGAADDAPPLATDETRRAAPAGSPPLVRFGSPDIRISREPIEPEESLRDRVVRLYKKGFSADIIAARLGSTIAEVELVLSIEEQRSLLSGGE